MKATIALSNFEIVLPQVILDQVTLLDHASKAHANVLTASGGDGSQIQTLMRRYGVKPTQISQRGFENIHIGIEGKDILERTEFFGERGREIFRKFYPMESAAPAHIIHVTCTGYISPSPAQHLVNDNQWAESTNVTHAYHMGCYASLPAVRMAEGFCAAQKGRVDIVHTEMCGLHMDSQNHVPEQLVVQSLFADGHVKYSAQLADQVETGFRVIKIREQIIPDSQVDMTWVPASWGMKMTLSRDVPQKIGSSLRGFVQKLVESSGYKLEEVLKDAVFAVHPGGPKIIDAVREILEISEDQVSASREILLRHGNMSSATLPHVWHQLLQNKIPSQKLVVSLAFGPGLTIFGALFETI